MPFLKVDILKQGSTVESITRMIGTFNEGKSGFMREDMDRIIPAYIHAESLRAPSIYGKYRVIGNNNVISISEDEGLTDTLRIYWE
jgi:hypothetical protein